jgi:hypothetical protein
MDDVTQVREDDPHLPVTSLVAVENSHNKEDDKLWCTHLVEPESIETVKEAQAAPPDPLAPREKLTVYLEGLSHAIDLKNLTKIYRTWPN